METPGKILKTCNPNPEIQNYWNPKELQIPKTPKSKTPKIKENQNPKAPKSKTS